MAKEVQGAAMIEKDKIELAEIVEVQDLPTKPGYGTGATGPYWKVTIAMRDRHGAGLEGTWFLPKKEFPDSSILPIARSFLHRLCKDIADSTAEWALDNTQFESLKRHPGKGPS
jgi:hypothetical protein